MKSLPTKPTILILLSRFPYPLYKGDKLRAFYQIKELSNTFSIQLVCLSDVKISEAQKAELTPYCFGIHIIQLNKFKIAIRLLNALNSKLPFQVHYFYSKKAQQKIDALVEQYQPKHIYCQLIRTAEYVKKYSVIPKTLDYMDALSLGMQRRINTSNSIFNTFIQQEFKRLTSYEKECYGYFESHTTIAEVDAVHIADKPITIVRNGVLLDYFSPAASTSKKYDLVFTGNMSYAPNVAAAQFLAHEIIPILTKKLPTIQLLIAGINPDKKVKQLENENITVSGFIPDIRDAYNQSKLFIAPMQLGSGLQNKLLEAMAMEMACISSEICNASLGATNQKNIILCSKPEEYAFEIEQLLQNPAKQERIGKSARAFVEQNYSWKKSIEPLIHLIE